MLLLLIVLSIAVGLRKALFPALKHLAEAIPDKVEKTFTENLHSFKITGVGGN